MCIDYSLGWGLTAAADRGGVLVEHENHLQLGSPTDDPGLQEQKVTLIWARDWWEA